jgi:hypothetical protein
MIGLYIPRIGNLCVGQRFGCVNFCRLCLVNAYELCATKHVDSVQSRVHSFCNLKVGFIMQIILVSEGI